MPRRLINCFILMFIASFAAFGQTSALRDYVGMISQKFHPDIISFMEDLKKEFERRGHNTAAKSVDIYLKGESGTGFVYVTGGKNYILTNYHVISQSNSLSVSFEKPDGEKTVFSDITIIAADEERDIALLSFSGGQNPFTQGLSFYTRPLQEGDDVYSAGFPGLGTTLVWQLGRGMVSNASVRFPDFDDAEKTHGPFIQHTAQVDPGNSGGPLLIQTQGVPTGFAVAGINTLSARYRQAANFSIPINQVQSFIDASLQPKTEDELSQLNARLNSFIEGLGVNKTVYSHIAAYLSNDCTGENAEFAMDEIFAKAPLSVRDRIVDTFVRSPVDGMAHAVAWTIENSLRSKTGKIDIKVDSVHPEGDGKYTVNFLVNESTISSQWINEYGIWRIRIFSDFAAGDKTRITKRKEEKEISKKLLIHPTIRISANYAAEDDIGSMFAAELKVGLSDFISSGFQAFLGNNFFNFEGIAGFYIPIQGKNIAFIPFADLGVGMMKLPPHKKEDDFYSSDGPAFDFGLGVSVKGGIMFTTSALPGVYLQAVYKHNFYMASFFGGLEQQFYPSVIMLGIGYSFD